MERQDHKQKIEPITQFALRRYQAAMPVGNNPPANRQAHTRAFVFCAACRR